MRPSWSSTIGRHAAGLMLAIAVTLALAPRADAAPKDGQAFQDWMVKCEGGNGKAEQCIIYQNIVLTNSGRRLLTLKAGYVGPKGELWVIMTLPLGIYLPSGVALKVDKGQRFDAAIKICTAKGCEAGIPMNDVLKREMMKGLVARIVFLDGSARRQITVPTSLKGFSAAIRTLTVPNAKGAATR